MTDGEDGAIAKLVVQVAQIQRAVSLQIQPAQLCTRTLAGQLPGHQVGVMLQFADQHGFAGFEHSLGQASGNQVDAVRRTFGEHDVVARWCIEQRGDRVTGRLIALGGALGKRVGAAVHIGIVTRVVMRQCIDDGLRLLRGRRVVQVGQALAAGLLVQGGKLRANGFHVKFR